MADTGGADRGETDARAALADATARLAAVSDTPRLDAELLLAHALGVERSALLLDLARHAVPPAFATLVARRLAHEPVAYILGYRDFWTIRLAVGPGALIPRPDSETLIEAAVAHFAGTPGPARILDLGTGPGTLLLAALAQWPRATGLGIDRSAAALAYATANAAALGCAERVRFRIGDWTDGIADRFDLILANPPYIATQEMADLQPEVALHEPVTALDGGADGLDAYRALTPDLARLLAPTGRAFLEIGHDQAGPLQLWFIAAGFTVKIHQDLAALDRCLELAWAPPSRLREAGEAQAPLESARV